MGKKEVGFISGKEPNAWKQDVVHKDTSQNYYSRTAHTVVSLQQLAKDRYVGTVLG